MRFSKGHATQNDFVLVLDPDEDLRIGAERVRALCDRRAGIGGDGLIRATRREGAWFMDYRNADGSVAEMCGNGVRALAEFLVHTGQVTTTDFASGLRVGTRGGEKVVTRRDDGWYAVDMGPWRATGGESAVAAGGDAEVRVPGMPPLPSLSFDLGNPHTVVVLPDEEALRQVDLTRPPLVTPNPAEGVNVEFIVVGDRLDPHTGHLTMRVHERGVGETRSCGTGACAAMLAAWTWAGADAPRRWAVDVPGGRLLVSLLPNGNVELAGPAMVVADGDTPL